MVLHNFIDKLIEDRVTGFIGLGTRLFYELRNLNVVGMSQDAEGGQEPHEHANDHDDIQNLFDLSIHGDVGVDQPEQNADDD